MQSSNIIKATLDVIEYISSLEYGALVPTAKLNEYFNYNLEDEKEKRKFNNIMRKIKNVLIEKGFMLRTITGKGYYIMKPQQISGYCYHTYICKMDKILGKTEKILNHIEKDKMSPIRRVEHKEVKTLNRKLRDNISVTIENSDYYEHKSTYDALKD